MQIIQMESPNSSTEISEMVNDFVISEIEKKHSEGISIVKIIEEINNGYPFISLKGLVTIVTKSSKITKKDKDIVLTEFAHKLF